MTTPQQQKRAAKIDHWRNRKGLGRKPSADERDKQFPLRAAMLRRAALPASKTWPLMTAVLDQGSTSQCVAYSWTQFLFCAPVTHKVGSLGDIAQFARSLYDWAQRNDEWPGEGYDGTSVRAGAKGLVEMGYIAKFDPTGTVTGSDVAGYRWAKNADEARDFVRGIGPMIFGIDWYDEMFATDSLGFVKPKGALAGGHAILVVGFSQSRDAFRLVNSWGREWGQAGRCWLSRKDANMLIADRDGEACSAVELRKATKSLPEPGVGA